VKTRSSLEVRSAGIRVDRLFENPNIKFIHDRKKNTGPNKYKKTRRKIAKRGNRSKKKLKNKNSETKKIEPGKPKNIKVFNRVIRNSLGHIKFKPLTSVINLVLKRRATASTNRNELADNNA
jgi:hypothetical protein